MHQLETLLEANVDKAFDKFEIYVLRNIFTVPEDLLGWLRLKHYEVGYVCLEIEAVVFLRVLAMAKWSFFLLMR